MRITIAGYGSIGHYLAGVFGSQHEIVLYDPPRGFGSPGDLVDTDFVFICVPTPPRDDGSADISIVEDVVSRARPSVAVVCESTVPIGTTDRLIERYAAPLVFVPEYAGESADHPFRDTSQRHFLIYGGYGEVVERVRDLYAGVYPASTRHFITTPATAEMAKYMENAFLALKVAFCNEFFDLCGAAGVDFKAARELWLQDWRIGSSHTVVTAQRGYGGKCLPKDVAAVIATGRELGAPMQIMETVQSANARHRAAGSAPALAANPAERTQEEAARPLAGVSQA
jgi:UDPglucose 6-dehydrogenase